MPDLFTRRLLARRQAQTFRRAVHEAGHAVIVHHYGGVIERIKINTNDGESAGHCLADIGSNNTLRLGVMSMGGRIAIRLAHLPVFANEYVGDYRTIRAIAVRERIPYLKFRQICEESALDILRQKQKHLMRLAKETAAKWELDGEHIHFILDNPVDSRWII